MKIERLLLLSQLKDQVRGLDCDLDHDRDPDHDLNQLEDSAELFKQQFGRFQEQWKSDLKSKGFSYISLFRLKQYLFIYLEYSIDDSVFEWPQSCLCYLEQWPSGYDSGWAIQLMDVFHDGTPDKAPWRKQQHVKEVHASMQQLKPEMVSSYIYYHYLKQEEQPESFNKTYMIGAFQNLLFSYQELPATKSDYPSSGSLDTKNTPKNWHEIMQPHFKLDSTSDKPWQPMELWFTWELA